MIESAQPSNGIVLADAGNVRTRHIVLLLLRAHPSWVGGGARVYDLDTPVPAHRPMMGHSTHLTGVLSLLSLQRLRIT